MSLKENPPEIQWEPCERCARTAPCQVIKLNMERQHHPSCVVLTMALCEFCVIHLQRDMRQIIEDEQYSY